MNKLQPMFSVSTTILSCKHATGYTNSNPTRLVVETTRPVSHICQHSTLSLTMATVTTSSRRPYHVVIFGASGFTGQFVVEEVAKAIGEGPEGNLKWAVAGRSRRKLENVLNHVANTLDTPELKCAVEVIVADVRQPESLAIMCKQAVIVLNCVGPYRFYGEPVVKACVENGAHYIDICGEPQFLEAIQLVFDRKARENSVYVIGSCGFDSLPADMGILYTKEKFKGTLTAVESFLTVSTGPEGGCGHDATWQSAIFGFADAARLRSLRKQFKHKPLPELGAKIKKRGALFFCKEIGQYAVPFMGSDPSVVRRTQRYLCEEEDQQCPVQYCAYAGVGGVCSVLKLLFSGFFFWLLVKFSLGRHLLIKCPAFFSWGLFSKAGPTQKQMEGTSFRMTFYGEGYTKGRDPSQGMPDGRITTEIRGAEPGYVVTPVVMVQAAMTFLNELQSLPERGGVFTPGAAFARTSLIQRLQRHGLKFTATKQQGAP
ncbi:saccharopine dehydrogenase-like oxidoreductase isoform X2 [Alosa sapidissima]|uniref:saccharopine dehydrogenase-like oxidoreductase isoform X2 n=1 Tax=Alosa sapidissima TaxID=34773 RepID=UPI001C0973CD|nr:saccharopine dehydrogenase-like oxidoreductase isoform X2 [Alosa sapidissima]